MLHFLPFPENPCSLFDIAKLAHLPTYLQYQVLVPNSGTEDWKIWKLTDQKYQSAWFWTRGFVCLRWKRCHKTQQMSSRPFLHPNEQSLEVQTIMLLRVTLDEPELKKILIKSKNHSYIIARNQEPMISSRWINFSLSANGPLSF